MIRLTIYVLFVVLIFLNTGYGIDEQQYGVLIKKTKLLKVPRYSSSWYRTKISVGDTLKILADDHEKYFSVEYGSYDGWVNKKKIKPIILEKVKSLMESPEPKKEKSNQTYKVKSLVESPEPKKEKSNQTYNASSSKKIYQVDQNSDVIKVINLKYVLYVLIAIAIYRVRLFLLKPINAYKNVKNWIESLYFKCKGIISVKNKYEKQLKALIGKTRIKDPFNKVNLRHVCLGDLFLESALDAYSLNNILSAYGIKNIEGAIDPSSSPVFETLGRLGEESFFYDGFGLPITDPNFTSNIIPSSNLARISDYVNSKNWSIDSLKGHTTETVIKNTLEEQGYNVIYPEDSRNEGFDLLIEEKFFKDNNIPFVKDSELSWVENPSGLGALQIKNVSSSTEITKHFLKNEGKYEMIPVLAPDGTFDSGILEPYEHLIKGYSEIDGLSLNTFDEIEALVGTDIDKLAAGHYGFIDSGMEIDKLSAVKDQYYGFDLIDNLDIPYIGMLITAYISSSKSYRAYKGNEINLPTAVKNTSNEIVRHGFASIGSMYTTNIFAEHILSYEGGTTGVFSSTFSGLEDGFDFEDLGDLFSIFALYKIAKFTFKKLLFDNKSKEQKELGKLYGKLNTDLNGLTNIILNNKDFILKTAKESSTWFYDKRLERINKLLNIEYVKKKNEKRDLPTTLSYFLEYAKNKQQSILSEIDENKEKFFHGKVQNAYERISRLEKVESKSFKIMKTEIYQIKNNLKVKEMNKHYSSPLAKIKKSKAEMKHAISSIKQAEILYISSIIRITNGTKSNYFKIDNLNFLLDRVKSLFKKIAQLKAEIDKKENPDKSDPILL